MKNNSLERFTKNKKQKKIIIASIVAVVLLIGGISLYRTFALYEEKKEFNILNGRIPDFSDSSNTDGDIILAFTINGEKTYGSFPTKDANLTINNVTCENGATAEWDSTNWGLTKINPGDNKSLSCIVDFTIPTLQLDSIVKVGDYIKMTPNSTSYTISKDDTGYDTDQEINPSELNIWRVIKVNSDHSIEVISEYTSSNEVYFKGPTGYKKLVEVLNTIAEQYKNSFTINTRYVGFNGQATTVSLATEAWAINWPANIPWKTSTNDHENAYENSGGGDNLYTKDADLIKESLTTLKANKVNTTTESTYWLASRNYSYSPAGRGTYETVSLAGRYISSNGSMSISTLSNHTGSTYTMNQFSVSNSIRPIVTISDGLSATGIGTSDYPYILENE